MASYFKVNSLLTPAEMNFYQYLVHALPEKHILFSKVRVYDILRPYAGHRSSCTSRIIQKHLDFVVCDATTLEPLIAIELDDSSHNRPDRRERDHFLNVSLIEAGVKVLRVPAKRTYDPDLLKGQLVDLLRTDQMPLIYQNAPDRQQKTKRRNPAPPSQTKQSKTVSRILLVAIFLVCVVSASSSFAKNGTLLNFDFTPKRQK